MSHIGNKIIKIPKLINIEIDNNLLKIKGQFGIEELLIPNNLNIIINNNEINIVKIDNSKKTHSYQGLYRSLIQNIIIGVNNKFNKILYIKGTGYKFKIEKNILEINIGFSHLIKLVIPKNLEIKLESSNKLIISGINKEKVNFFASKIYKLKPPEPYKGKGIIYEGQKIKTKIGKTGK